MKEKVLAILSCKKSDSDKFNELFALYRSLPGKSDSLVKHFNTRGFSQETFEDLSYQTKKLLSISDLEAASYKSKPCHDCGGGKAKPEELPKKKTETKEASQENTSFREEYPFLNDLEVPEEFKILAADKISAYKLLQDGHAKLQGAKEGNSDLSEAELAEIAQEVAEADELNSLIKEEFDHYQETGEVLGKHPIFAERKLIKKIEAMTGPDKSKRLSNLATYIRRDGGKMEKAIQAGKTAEADKFAAKIEGYELEKKLIEKSM